MPPRIPQAQLLTHLLGRTELVGACREWQGALNNNGYGRLRVGNREFLVHRYIYELCTAPLQAGQVVMHTCDNRKCVEPSHLVAGTQSENILDAFTKGRRRQDKENNTHRKLNQAQVDEIRRLRSGMTLVQLGKLFDVHPTTVDSIIQGRTWR